MTRDFTLGKYTQLLKAVNASCYNSYTVLEYLNKDRPQDSLIIRHDVDRQLMNALRMAELEYKHGIKTSYYFRFNKSVFKPEIITKIDQMGHEVGYHYETMDKAKGDTYKAIALFKQELEEFRNIADVKTICMHGNPLTTWDNRDLWKHYDYKTLGIIGEAYLDITNIAYLSDTGRNWGDGLKVKDWLPTNDEKTIEQLTNLQRKTTDDVIDIINRELFNDMYILVHPERWASSFGEWIAYYFFDATVAIAKKYLSLKNRCKN